MFERHKRRRFGYSEIDENDMNDLTNMLGYRPSSVENVYSSDSS
jgi:hypothetical protein